MERIVRLTTQNITKREKKQIKNGNRSTEFLLRSRQASSITIRDKSRFFGNFEHEILCSQRRNLIFQSRVRSRVRLSVSGCESCGVARFVN